MRNALPGLVAGGLGLLAGLCALVFDWPLLGAIAGALALVAGLAGVHLARQFEERGALQTLVEAELRAMRERVENGATDVGLDGDGPPVVDDHHPDDQDDAGAALIDQRTGLFSESFFLVALDSRIAAARRHLRPIGMVLLEVVEGLPAEEPRAIDALLVARAIKDTLREADTACRLRNGYFALLLEDTPENGAIWTVERIRRRLATEREGLTVWAGVACYPAHAFSRGEMLEAAEQALTSARDWRRDRVEVAAALD